MMHEFIKLKNLLKKQILSSFLKVPINWIQHWGVNEQDLFIASYPKSGSTWLRFMLFQLLLGSDSSFSEVNRYIPTVGKHFFLRAYLDYSFKRIIKTHEPFRTNYKHAIYIVRDPRDVLISEFHYQRMTRLISDRTDFDDFFELFLNKGVNRFGTWKNNVNSWLKAKSKNFHILILRYEDMLNRPHVELETIMDFLELEIESGEIDDAIQNNTLINMQKKEQSGRDKTFKNSRKDIKFVRKGKSGGWKEVLSAHQKNMINQKLSNELKKFNYFSD
jgi:hypothetical protein